MSLPYSPDGKHVETYKYTPTSPPAYAFTIIFGLAAAAHIPLLMLYRSRFMLPLLIGCICEAGGYYGRIWSAQDPGNIKPWVLTSLLTLGAPPFVAASVYMALGRFVRVLAPETHAGLRPGLVAKLYVFFDVLSLVSQLAGAGMQVTTDPTVQESGGKVILGGLIFHSLAFVAFIAVAVVFHRRIKREPEGVVREEVVGWENHMWALYAASLAILVRNIVRGIEYAQGRDGPLLGSEAPIYALDAAPMAFVVVLYAVLHPGRLIKQSRAYYQAGGSKA